MAVPFSSLKPAAASRWTLVCLLWMFQLSAVATAAGQLSEQSFFIDAPLVLSASRLYQPIEEAPAAVTIITREMIRASGARDIPDLFRLVPGFVVGVAENSRVATSQHGLTSSMSRRMQVMVDGRSITTPLFGGVQWYALPLDLEDIERIEVLRGPNASSYGASAFLGVINITTRHAAEDQGLHTTLRAGNNGILDGHLAYAGGSHGLDWRIGLRYQQDEGLDMLDDGRELQGLSLRTDYQIDRHNQLLLQGGLSRSPRNLASLNPNIPAQRQETDSYFAQLRWEHTRQQGGHFWLQAYHSFADESQPFSYVFNGAPGQPSDDSPLMFNTRRTDIEFEDTRHLSDSLRFVWGGGHRRDRLVSEWFFDTNEAIDTDYSRLFSHLEWRVLAPLTLNLGAMYEHHDFTGDGFSPRLALNYRFAPRQVIRFGAARATRVPVVYEEMSNVVFVASNGSDTFTNHAFISTGGLEAETIVSYELGYLGRFLDGRLDLDGRLYRDSLSKLIARHRLDSGHLSPPDFNATYNDYLNSDTATVYGGELQVDYRLSSRHFYRLAYAYTEVDSSDVAQNLSDSAPKHLLTLLGAYPLPRGVDASAAYYFSSGHTYLTDFDGGLGGDPLDAIHRVDLRLAYPFRQRDTRHSLALVVQNALGDYHEFQEENAFQRRVWLELRSTLP